MALWPSKRAHLRAVDLAEVPDTGPPLNPQTHGDIMREKTDAMLRARGHVVHCEGELGRAQEAYTAAEIDLLRAIKDLGIRPESVDTAWRRNEG